MQLTLLVDSAEFVDSFTRDALGSTESVYVQVMTFEADKAGQLVADVLRRSAAPDKRLLVDRYIDVMISDRLYRSPRNRRDSALQEEVRDTFGLLDSLPHDGVATRLANPTGPWFLRMVARDHVKIYAIDRRIAYIGGLNISDHNFEWHDCMLRIEDRGVASFLAERFLDSWNGQPTSGKFSFEDLDLVFFDGRSNRETFRMITGLVDEATESLWIQSPYVSFPFFGHLRQAARRGVRVDVVSPGRNNKPLMDSYTAWEAHRSGIHLRHLPYGMTHLKACLIDGRLLLLGSSNLDYLSTTVQRELIAVIRDDRLVFDFNRRVRQVDTDASVPFSRTRGDVKGPLAGIVLYALMGTAAAGARLATAADRVLGSHGRGVETP